VQSFAAGFISGGLKSTVDLDFDAINKINIYGLDLSIFSVVLDSIGSDVTKKIALTSMNEEYKLYIKKINTNNSLIFFNGFAQSFMYHNGK